LEYAKAEEPLTPALMLVWADEVLGPIGVVPLLMSETPPFLRDSFLDFSIDLHMTF
jgi:hypothetical protein